MMEKVQEKPVFSEGEKGKSTNSRLKYFYKPTPNAFFLLLEKRIFTATEFAVASSLHAVSQSENNRNKKSFAVSYEGIAKKTNTGRRFVFESVQRFVKLGLLTVKSQRIGCVNKYAWDVDKFNELEVYLCTEGTGTSALRTLPRCTEGTGTSALSALCLISQLIKTLLTSYNVNFPELFSVDNSEIEGDSKAGPLGPFVSWDQMSAALEAAVWSTWHSTGRGGTFTLDHIHLVLKGHLIAPSVVNPTGYLLTLLRDGSLRYELEKKHSHFYKTEAEVISHLITLKEFEDEKEN